MPLNYEFLAHIWGLRVVCDMYDTAIQYWLIDWSTIHPKQLGRIILADRVSYWQFIMVWWIKARFSFPCIHMSLLESKDIAVMSPVKKIGAFWNILRMSIELAPEHERRGEAASRTSIPHFWSSANISKVWTAMFLRRYPWSWRLTLVL